MWSCKVCGRSNPDPAQVCTGCGKKRGEAGAGPARRRVTAENYDYKPGLATALEVAGWLVLASGVLSLILVFFTLKGGMLIFAGAVGSAVGAAILFLCLRALAAVVWDSGTTKALTMQMYDKIMNDDKE